MNNMLPRHPNITHALLGAVQTTYFDQRFYGTFFLEPEVATSSIDGSAPSSGRTSKAGPSGSG